MFFTTLTSSSHNAMGWPKLLLTGNHPKNKNSSYDFIVGNIIEKILFIFAVIFNYFQHTLNLKECYLFSDPFAPPITLINR
jgi:hypothetical protein